MKNERDRGQEILNMIGAFLHAECERYAIKKLKSNDFVSVQDTQGKRTEGVLHRIGKEKYLHTIKESSRTKYNDFYYEKLDKIWNKMVK